MWGFKLLLQFWPLCTERAVCHDTLATASSVAQQKHVVPRRGKPPLLNSLAGVEGFLLDSDENKVSRSPTVGSGSLEQTAEWDGDKERTQKWKRQDRMCVHSVRRQSRLRCLGLFPVTWNGPIKAHLSPYPTPLFPSFCLISSQVTFSARMPQVRASRGSELSQAETDGPE